MCVLTMEGKIGKLVGCSVSLLQINVVDDT
jgi:hypothetical protein